MTERNRLLARAHRLWMESDYAKAFALYESLLFQKDEDAEVLREYARAKYEEYDDLSGSAQLFERALVLEPNSIETLLWLGDLYALGRGQGYAAAANMYRRALQLDPALAEAYVALGRIYDLPGQPITYEEAVTAYRRAVQLDPTRTDAHHNLAMILLRSQNTEDAMREFRIEEELLLSSGKRAKAEVIRSIIDTLERDEPVTSGFWEYDSPRYVRRAEYRSG